MYKDRRTIQKVDELASERQAIVMWGPGAQPLERKRFELYSVCVYIRLFKFSTVYVLAYFNTPT